MSHSQAIGNDGPADLAEESRWPCQLTQLHPTQQYSTHVHFLGHRNTVNRTLWHVQYFVGDHVHVESSKYMNTHLSLGLTVRTRNEFVFPLNTRRGRQELTYFGLLPASGLQIDFFSPESTWVSIYPPYQTYICMCNDVHKIFFKKHRADGGGTLRNWGVHIEIAM